MHIYAYLYTYKHMYTCKYTYSLFRKVTIFLARWASSILRVQQVRACIYIFIYLFIYLFMNTYLYTYLYTYKHMYTCIYINSFFWKVNYTPGSMGLEYFEGSAGEGIYIYI